MIGHRQRLLQKFLEHSASFEPVDLIELCLFITNSRKNTRIIARQLLQKYKLISSIAAADLKDLRKIEGIGEFSALFLKALFKICETMLQERIIKQPFEIENLTKYILLLTQEKNYEILYIAMLDIHNRVMQIETIAEGENASVQVNLNKLTRLILNAEPNSIILIHNHPSGNIQPSNDDIETTKKIKRILTLFNISIYDSLIINFKGDIFSMSQRNLI